MTGVDGGDLILSIMVDLDLELVRRKEDLGRTDECPRCTVQ